MDRQFISYPKSGRSWIRYILHQLDLERLIHFHHDGCEFSDGSRPLLALDSPTRLDAYSQGQRIVYLRRDPRDVMVSLYHQVIGRMRDVFGYEGDISAFIRDGYFGAHNLEAFDRQWLRLCKQGLALCVSYEACHQDMVGVMRRVLNWYALDASDAALAAACEGASFEAMRAVELSESFAEPWLRPRNGATKTRRGIVGAYRDALTVGDIAYLHRMFEPLVHDS